MNFRIADTFTESLGRLTGDEQKAVEDHGFRSANQSRESGDELSQARPSEGQEFWSVRVSRDIRLIVHKTAAELLLCYVDHHARAYRWPDGAS